MGNSGESRNVCEGHGYDISRCLDHRDRRSGRMRCHWGPRDNDVCEDMMLDFIYNEEDEEEMGYER